MHHATPLSAPRSPVVYRSMLFVPGDRPDRFHTALAAGAGAVCIDLEDAVAPNRKEVARVAVSTFLAEQRPEGGPDVIVRLNDPESKEWRDDVKAVSTNRPDALMIPKVKTEEGVKWVADVFGAGVRLLPLIETAQGLDNVTWIASATSAVSALVFGGFDLALQLGAVPEWDSLLYARSRVVHAAALNRIAAIDMPSRDIDRPDALREEADRARRMGFAGKIAIHPAQVPVIEEVFTPSPEQVAWARRVDQASQESGEGAVMVDGKMVDRPIAEAARRILAAAGGGPGL
ncbi:MAG: CoA ester lyase [Gemmatimonadetes bacterium]|nr:CoA ester lyase [Gemmatimonadota bacterium]